MSYAVHSGCRLNYRVDGNATGDPILFSNSLGTTLELWQPQLDALSPSFKIIRYDTRGHGASDAPGGPYSLDELGRDALAILDGAGVRRAHVCGLSLGGLTAMWLGVHAPDRVGSIVLASTAARIANAIMWQERITQVNAAGLESLAATSMGRWFTEGFRQIHPEVVATYQRMLAASPAGGYTSCCAALRDADLRNAVGTIRAPVLAIAGREDPATPPSDADDIAARIRGARVSLLDAAHIANVEQADAFNDLLIAFFRQHPLDPSHG